MIKAFASAPALALLLAAAGCRPPEEAAPAAPPPTVEVAAPVVRDVTEWDEYTGRLAAVEAVDVRARVGGYLESVHFRDGQHVAKGDLLFVIDPRPYRAALAAVEGDRNGLVSRLALARTDLARVQRLRAGGAVSQEEIDTRTREAEAAAAAVEAVKARVERARLDLEFTEVRAPMAGRVDRHAASVGNLIGGGTADATVLTSVVTVDPIHCYFDVDERAYLAYNRLAQAGERPSSRDAPNPVWVRLADEREFGRQGKMDFVGNRLDGQTATVRVRAVLPNPGGVLTPGMFAQVRLRGRGPYRAVLVPDAVVGTDQARKFVYVVRPDGVAERRYVTPGRLHDGLRAIESGLSAEDRVVVSALHRVRPGQPVAVAPPATPAGPGTPAAGGATP